MANCLLLFWFLLFCCLCSKCSVASSVTVTATVMRHASWRQQSDCCDCLRDGMRSTGITWSLLTAAAAASASAAASAAANIELFNLNFDLNFCLMLLMLLFVAVAVVVVSVAIVVGMLLSAFCCHGCCYFIYNTACVCFIELILFLAVVALRCFS